ncbi:hypothetical protein [Mycoplasmoides fastidiosum]|uniref:hypothetical protein n=1 Tax=Mycoplasmoides fastidiosum TaxID=92758 RepID=UPI002113F56F|nr:hypothetical protein [Mycoplasmoides fastidiosum]UUD37322.1 hypothetical protein NPA10_01935 [Mycoplasmoides fastidiosum]
MSLKKVGFLTASVLTPLIISSCSLNNTESQNNFSEISSSSNQQKTTSNNSQTSNDQVKDNLPKLPTDQSSSIDSSNQGLNSSLNETNLPVLEDSKNNNLVNSINSKPTSESVLQTKLTTPLQITGYKKHISNVDNFITSLQDSNKQNEILQEYFETNYDSDPNLTFQIIGSITKLSNQTSSDNIQNITKLRFKYQRKYQYQKLLNNQLTTQVKNSETNTNFQLDLEILPEVYWQFKNLSVKSDRDNGNKELYEKQFPSFWKNLLDKNGTLNNTNLSIPETSKYSQINISTDDKSSLGLFAGFVSHWLESKYKNSENSNNNYLWKLHSITETNDLTGLLKFNVQLFQQISKTDGYVPTNLISNWFEVKLLNININEIKQNLEKGLHIVVNEKHNGWSTKITNWKEQIHKAYTEKSKVLIDNSNSFLTPNNQTFVKSKIPEYFTMKFEKISYLSENLSDISESIWPIQISFIENPSISSIYFEAKNNESVKRYIVYSLKYTINSLEDEVLGNSSMITSVSISGSTPESYTLNLSN